MHNKSRNNGGLSPKEMKAEVENMFFVIFATIVISVPILLIILYVLKICGVVF